MDMQLGDHVVAHLRGDAGEQPRVLISLARTAPNSCGSRGSGPGPEYPRSRLPDPPPVAFFRAAGGFAARRALAASRTARASSGPGTCGPAGASACPPSEAAELSGTSHLPLRHVVPYATQPRRYVRRHGTRDEQLRRTAGQLGETVPPADVQLGEHVVQRQYRLDALRAQQLVRGQPQ